MKKTVFAVFLTLAIMFSVVGSAFAAGPVEYTIDVRNRTGAPVELNYRATDGILRWVNVPEGVSTLTLTEGVYVYWADPKCGHIAGSMNISQQRQILWISCDHAVPALMVTKSDKSAGGIDPACATPFIWYLWSVHTYEETHILYGLCWDEILLYDFLSAYEPNIPQWHDWDSIGTNTESEFETDICGGYEVYTDDLIYYLTGIHSPLGRVPACFTPGFMG